MQGNIGGRGETQPAEEKMKGRSSTKEERLRRPRLSQNSRETVQIYFAFRPKLTFFFGLLCKIKKIFLVKSPVFLRKRRNVDGMRHAGRASGLDEGKTKKNVNIKACLDKFSQFPFNRLHPKMWLKVCRMDRCQFTCGALNAWRLPWEWLPLACGRKHGTSCPLPPTCQRLWQPITGILFLSSVGFDHYKANLS